MTFAFPFGALAVPSQDNPVRPQFGGAMLAALVVLAGALGPTPALAAARVDLQTDDPAIRVSINSNGRFQRGDKAKVQVQTRDDGYLIVLQVDPDRRLRVLFPLDPRDDNFVRGHQKIDIRGRGGRESFRIDDGSGQGAVYAAISRDPYRFNDYQVGDHWDFRALNTVQVGDEIEADLNEFVRKIAVSDFDYDLQRYDVYDRAYASSTTYVTEMYGYGYGSPNWGDGYFDSCFGYWGCGYGGRTHLFIGVGFGRPFYAHPYYGSPFFYDPWYYSPVYFRPRYYAPVYYPRYPYNPGYRIPYRPRSPGGAAYARDFYHGGYYTSPWRARDPRGGVSTYSGGKGAFGGSYVPGRLASGLTSDGTWRNRGVVATPVGGTGSTYVPRRQTDARASDARPTDMTPTRGEGRRAGPEVVEIPSARTPEARPADGRQPPRRQVSEPRRDPNNTPRDARDARRDINDLPRRVGPVGDPVRLNDNQPASRPQIVPPAGDRGDVDARSREPHPVEPRPVDPRSTEPRGSDARVPEARPAMPRDVRDMLDDPGARGIDRPAPRDMTGGGSARAPEPRPNMEPARRDAPPPPRMEAPRREAPAPRVERSAPRERPSGGGNGGGNRGGGGGRRPSPRQ